MGSFPGGGATWDGTVIDKKVEKKRRQKRNIILLLQTWVNYHVYIDSSYEQEGFMLYTKEDVGAIVAKTSAPAITFAINENNMTAAFWDYLIGKINRIDDWQLNKSITIRRLQYLIDKIK